jgi:hypothetical protein
MPTRSTTKISAPKKRSWNAAHDGRHQHHHRDRADPHPLEMGGDRRRIDRMAAPELHLGAANRRAENVQSQHYVGKAPEHTAADPLKESDPEPIARWPDGFGLFRRRIADRADERLGLGAHAGERNRRTTFLETRDETVDDPCAGGIEPFDPRNVYPQPTCCVLRFDPAYRRIGFGDRGGRPGARQRNDGLALGTGYRNRRKRSITASSRTCVGTSFEQHHDFS